MLCCMIIRICQNFKSLQTRKALKNMVEVKCILHRQSTMTNPNGIEAQKEKLEAEGHTIIQRGRKNIRYYVKDYENSLFDLK